MQTFRRLLYDSGFERASILSRKYQLSNAKHVFLSIPPMPSVYAEQLSDERKHKMDLRQNRVWKQTCRSQSSNARPIRLLISSSAARPCAMTSTSMTGSGTTLVSNDVSLVGYTVSVMRSCTRAAKLASCSSVRGGAPFWGVRRYRRLRSILTTWEREKGV